MNIYKSALLILSTLLSFDAMSATDPVKWTLKQHFPSQVEAQTGTYVAVYTLTSQLPYTMVKPLLVQKVTNAPSEFTYKDSCSGKKLAHNQSCDVSLLFKPIAAGKKTIELIEVYGNERVPLPTLSINVLKNGKDFTGAVTTALPATMDINTSAPWQFTFTNNDTTPATGINISVAGNTYNTNCKTVLSNTPPHNSCYVQGTYTAASTGAEKISVRFSYTQGKTIQLNTSTTVGASGALVCTAAVPFAPQILVNSVVNPVTLLCTNKGSGDITITSHTPTYPTQGSFVPGVGGDNCTAQVLHHNASCQLSGAYTAPSSPAANQTLSLQVNYTPSVAPATVSTETDVVTTITNKRTIHLVNKCNFNVWWSMVGGAITNSPACTSNTDCPTGSTCNTSAKTCYYNNYGPTSGSYSLIPTNGLASTEIISTAASQLGDDVLWKGLISASTKCNNGKCANNDCQSNGGQSSCAAGVGFQQPATEAEFTLLNSGSGNVDTYDISNVNGFSMPMSMSTNVVPSSYTCGTAGNNVAVGSLKACNFSNVTPPSQMYYWVSNTGTSCNSKNKCANTGQICGLAFVPHKNTFAKMCGSFLGYWAANEICQTDADFSSPFGDSFTCKQHLGTPFPAQTYTLTQLLKCSPPNAAAPLFNSCYLNYPPHTKNLDRCCGCTNWAGVANPSASCPVGQTDPQWTSYVQPLIQWMKKACPTSYSYPYDDKASTFQCTASSSTSYTITFCPGTGNGLPSGKIDGRKV